jgi:hypothetical protein
MTLLLIHLVVPLNVLLAQLDGTVPIIQVLRNTNAQSVLSV